MFPNEGNLECGELIFWTFWMGAVIKGRKTLLHFIQEDKGEDEEEEFLSSYLDTSK